MATLTGMIKNMRKAVMTSGKLLDAAQLISISSITFLIKANFPYIDSKSIPSDGIYATRFHLRDTPLQVFWH